MTPKAKSPLQQAVAQLHAAQQIVVFTGAGVSKESGVPTFRDAQTGLWANYNPEDLATREGFLRDPAMVWSWYDFRRNRVWTVEPNPGHLALVNLQSWVEAQPERSWTLITQNIDNLHQRAGSTGVLELHGNIFRYKCLDRNHSVTLPEEQTSPQESLPPECSQCGSWVRPDVVWFGETLPENILNQSYAAAARADVMLIVGTSGVVYPAADIPQEARRNGACLIEINPEPSALTPMVDVFLEGPSGTILSELTEGVLSFCPREG
jgi:NAD-dependent deacetylase